MKNPTYLTLCAALVLTAYAASAQNTSADNTKNNRQDRTQGAVTADQQKNDSSDVDITKRIRRSVVADKSLSMYAHNVKIISVSGRVTLKGAVHSEEEKTAIATKAAQVVGADHVSNQLSVAPAK